MLVLFHFGGRGKTSGLELQRAGTNAAGHSHIRDGKVTRVVLYFDRVAALEDVGLQE